MPHSVNSIATNTSEDYVDELTTGIVYKYADYVFSGFDDKLIKGDDAFAEAMQGAKQTLKFSIMNAVIFSVTEYAIGRLAFASGAIYAYIKGTSAVSKVKSKARGLFRSLGKKGGFLMKPLKIVSDIALGSQEERLAMAKMANSSANNITSLVATERQTQTMMSSQKHDSALKTLGMANDSKFSRDNKKITAYNYKMKTGTWQNNVQDKNLFLSCVPKEYIKTPFSFNNSFVSELNSLREFAVSAEGKLTSLSQTHLDLLSASSLSKVDS